MGPGGPGGGKGVRLRGTPLPWDHFPEGGARPNAWPGKSEDEAQEA